jgi:predicted P-loop ATPase
MGVTVLFLFKRRFYMNNNSDSYDNVRTITQGKINEQNRLKVTNESFVKIFYEDPEFSCIRFNELKNQIEDFGDKGYQSWTDTDDARARTYIESKYGIYSLKKFDDAFRLYVSSKSYNPVKEIIERQKWDGEKRICNFLTEIMKADNSAYTKEVSRLIFAGGIHRLYNPGCKFDDMPVLVGTRQGEGKSTIVRWLALDDDFFSEVTEFEGQRGIESLEGAWICEVSELLAMTKAKDVEAVKSFITRQNDRYRMPFDRRVTDHKRSCIFIGTTNKEQFLTDKTGNRRFYPVRVYQTGNELFENENRIKAYILQCWAEALTLYDEGNLKPYADPTLIEVIRERQNSATQDDYREGMIRDFLESKQEVCIPMLWHEALKMRSDLKPTRKDSTEIGLIMQNCEGWVKQRSSNRFKDYGTQRYWKKEWIEL